MCSRRSNVKSFKMHLVTDCTCTSMYVRTRACIYVYTYIHTYICKCMYVYIYMHTYIHMYIHTYIHIYIVCMYISYILICKRPTTTMALKWKQPTETRLFMTEIRLFMTEIRLFMTEIRLFMTETSLSVHIHSSICVYLLILAPKPTHMYD
jgi:hypothetical protein